LSAQKLQSRYMAALSRISGTPVCGEAKRHTPIFQRGPAAGKKQAIRDAANALSALWKIGSPVKRYCWVGEREQFFLSNRGLSED
jgi:hypothetical protein